MLSHVPGLFETTPATHHQGLRDPLAGRDPQVGNHCLMHRRRSWGGRGGTGPPNREVGGAQCTLGPPQLEYH
jgi:hypothetical protein